LKKEKGMNPVEQIQKRERLVSGFIIVIAIVVGVFIAFLFTRLLDFFY